MNITAMLDGDDPRRYRVVGQLTKRSRPIAGERLMLLDHPPIRHQQPYPVVVTAIVLRDGRPTYLVSRPRTRRDDGPTGLPIPLRMQRVLPGASCATETRGEPRRRTTDPFGASLRATRLLTTTES